MKLSGPYNIVTRESFLASAKAGRAPQDAVLRKQVAGEFDAKATSTLGPNQRLFCISSDAVDRDNDVVSMQGWQTDNYKKNPVILWAHDYQALPVGKCVKLTTDGNKLMAVAEFADHDMALTVLRLIDGGFLNATSVGFRPLKYQINEDRRGLDFSEQELLEFSIVPVPANPEALIAASASAPDVAQLKSWAEGVITALAMNKGVSPGDVSMTKAADDTAWSAPGLGDFTSKSWDDLTASQKKDIAGHYAWADASVPTTFGDLKLPHHQASSGAVVWRGVANAAARMNQASIPSGDMGAVKAHLARHYKQFGNTPPWESQSAAWDAFLEKSVGKSDSEIAALADGFGFHAEAAALRPRKQVTNDTTNIAEIVKAAVEAALKAALPHRKGASGPSGESSLCTDCGQPMNGKPGARCLHPQMHETVPGDPGAGAPKGKSDAMCSSCGLPQAGPPDPNCGAPAQHANAVKDAAVCDDCGAPVNGPPRDGCNSPDVHDIKGRGKDAAMCDDCGDAISGPPGNGCASPDDHKVAKDAAVCDDCGAALNGPPGPKCDSPSGHSSKGKSKDGVMCDDCGAAVSGPPGQSCDTPSNHTGADGRKGRKSGRVISAANVARLKAAKAHLEHVINQAASPDASADGDGDADGGDVTVGHKPDAIKEFDLDAIKGSDDIVIDLSADDMRDAMRASLASVIRDVALAETRKAIDRKRGRVD